MEVSQALQKQASKLNVPVAYILIADMMSIGYSEQDAYTIAYPENAALSPVQNKNTRESILRSGKFKRVYEERMIRIKSGVATPTGTEDVELVGSEQVLKEILRSARSQPVGSKERAELFAKYNDIRQESENVQESVTDNISFVLPLKCNQCPLLKAYNDEMKKGGKRQLRPEEMSRVMALVNKEIEG